jgi:hypothetical protein
VTARAEDVEHLPRAAAVLLARLFVPSAKPPPQATLRKDVAGLVGPVDDAGWTAAVSSLAEAGWAAVESPPPKPARPPAKPKEVPLQLTGDGRTAARDRLGAAADRPKLTPATIKSFWKHVDSRPTAATVLLTRLYVPAAKPPTHAALRKSVADIIGPVDDAGWAAALSSLTAAGYIADPSPPPPADSPRPAPPPATGPVRLTDAGRAAVQAWLGMEAVPPALTWSAVRDRWLPAATVPPADRPAFADDKRVVALMLGQLFDVGPAGSVEAAIEAVVCKDLGHPEVRSLDELVAAVLARRLGKPIPPMPAKQRSTQVPAVAFGLPQTSAKAVRSAAVKRWAASGPAVRQERLDDLASFAAAVNGAAASSPTGWFGDDKVFISHVHRRLADGTPIGDFKRRLVEANTAGLVKLARADLVAAMDPADVQESETRYLTAEFHFVRVEQGRRS